MLGDVREKKIVSARLKELVLASRSEKHVIDRDTDWKGPDGDYIDR